MPDLDLDELERLWAGKRIRDIVRRVGNAESGLDAALDVIDTLLELVREQQEEIAHLRADHELAEEEIQQLGMMTMKPGGL